MTIHKPIYGFTDMRHWLNGSMRHWLNGAECFERCVTDKSPDFLSPAMAYGSWFHFYLVSQMWARLGGKRGSSPHGLPPKLSAKLTNECSEAAALGSIALCKSPIFTEAHELSWDEGHLKEYEHYKGRASFDAVATHADKIYLIDFKTYGSAEPWLTRSNAYDKIKSSDYDLQLAHYQDCMAPTDLNIYWVICWFRKKAATPPIVDVYEASKHDIGSTGRAKLATAQHNISTNYSADILYRVDRF